MKEEQKLIYDYWKLKLKLGPEEMKIFIKETEEVKIKALNEWKKIGDPNLACHLVVNQRLQTESGDCRYFSGHIWVEPKQKLLFLDQFVELDVDTYLDRVNEAAKELTEEKGFKNLI